MTAPLITRTPEQLPRSTNASAGALTLVQEPGGGVAAIEIWRLLGKPVAYDDTATVLSLLQAATRTAMAGFRGVSEGMVGYLHEGGREGMFRWTFADCSGAVAADPLQGLTLAPAVDPTGASGAWRRVYAGALLPEWFGAVTGDPAFAAANLSAIHACRDLGRDTLLAAGIYYVPDTVLWNVSDRRLFGQNMGYGGASASIIKITGGVAPTRTIFQFGAADYASVVRGLVCRDVCFDRDGASAPSSTGDVEDCTKGVLYRWATNSEMRRCRVLSSPVGIHVSLTATCVLADCYVQPATSTSADFSIAYAFGGYVTYPDFVGSNGSLRAEGNTAFGWPAAAWRAHTLVFGLPADTWIDKHEGSLGGHGVVVMGMPKADAISFYGGGAGPFGTLANAGSCQDVTISNTRMDGFAAVAMFFTHLNQWSSINVANPYVASSGTAFAWDQVQGRIDLIGGEALAGADGQGGADIAGTGLYAVRATLFRGFTVPVRTTGVNGAVIEPEIWQPAGGAAPAAIVMLSTARSLVRPQVRGIGARFAAGISMDAQSTFNTIDGGAIDPGILTEVDAAWKVRFNGADARDGGSGFAAAGNVLVGATG